MFAVIDQLTRGAVCFLWHLNILHRLWIAPDFLACFTGKALIDGQVKNMHAELAAAEVSPIAKPRNEWLLSFWPDKERDGHFKVIAKVIILIIDDGNRTDRFAG